MLGAKAGVIAGGEGAPGEQPDEPSKGEAAAQDIGPFLHEGGHAADEGGLGMRSPA